MIRRSTDMRNKVLGTDAFKARFDYGWLHIFSGSQQANADLVESGILLMEVSEQMAAVYASATTFKVNGDQQAIFADGRTIKLDISMAATFVSSTKFTVAGDQTLVFTENRGLRADCGADGNKYVSVSATAAVFDAGTDLTTVTVTESVLTANLEAVFYIEAHTVASTAYDGTDTTVTVDESTVTDGITTAFYGLRFGDPSAGAINILTGAEWKGRGFKGGSAASFRFYTNALETGAGTDKERFDGTCGLNGDLQMVSTTIQIGAQSTVDNFRLVEPA